MILLKSLVTWSRVFLAMHSFYNPSFCSKSTNTDFSRFFLKLSHLLKFIWYCISVLSFLLKYIFFHNRWFFLEYAPPPPKKKKNEKMKINLLQHSGHSDICIHFEVMANYCSVGHYLKLITSIRQLNLVKVRESFFWTIMSGI